jgi:hypothetical protein
MKKKIISVALLSLLSTSLPSHAELFDRGGGLVYDSDNNITWLADANYAKTSGFDADGRMTWSQANAWAANLTYDGYSDWRLPTTCFDCWPNNSDEMNNLYKELGGISVGSIYAHHNSQYGLFQNIQPGYYWTNKELPDDKSYAATYTFSFGFGLGWGKDDNYNAWAVRPGDSAALGFTPQNPVLPTANLPNGWQFDLTILNQLLYIDPQVAVGYDYLSDSGPTFASVLLPSVGNNQFSLYLWNGTEWTFDSTLNAGIEHVFGGAGVDRFRITGIETSAGLDPNSPTAFVTGLTFAGTGHASMHMNPLVQVVPEPETYAMLIAGLGLLGWRLRNARS